LSSFFRHLAILFNKVSKTNKPKSCWFKNKPKNKEKPTKNRCNRKHCLVKFIKTNLLHKTKNFPSNTFQNLTFIRHKVIIYFNYFYLYLHYTIYLFFIFFRLLGNTFFHHRCRTQSSAASKIGECQRDDFASPLQRLFDVRLGETTTQQTLINS